MYMILNNDTDFYLRKHQPYDAFGLGRMDDPGRNVENMTLYTQVYFGDQRGNSLLLYPFHIILNNFCGNKNITPLPYIPLQPGTYATYAVTYMALTLDMHTFIYIQY